MNPFEANYNEEISDSNKLINESIIEIWTEDRGRKTDTYVYGLPYNENELKDHLKIVKRKFGCNGSIKELLKDTGNIKVFHIQGNHKTNIINYLLEIGLNKDQLIIKG